MWSELRHFLKYWLHSKRTGFCLFALFALLFLLSFLFYRLPAEAALYPALLCALGGLLLLFFDARQAWKKHRALAQIRSVSEAVLAELPPPDGAEDEDYRRVLRLLLAEREQAETQMEARFAGMTDYYTVWAHQIKTPLAAMRLRLQNEDTPASRALTAELARVEQYVEMAMVFLRLDSDATDYVLREYELDGVVRQAVRRFAGEFIARRLRLDYEPLGVRVLTDEKWLLFVIEQLLSNALKYTPEGSVRIFLEPPQTLCIRDSGIGIAPEDLPRIFDKGYTGCNGRGDKSASGIGLYLCRRICRRLGHRLWAESSPEGTTMRLDLRRAELEVE